MTFLRRLVVGLLLAAAGVVLTTPFAQVAQADPHAVFYTAVGQQQLFFNILAALDQADYVEPAEGPLSRQELREKRNQALIAEAEKLGIEISTVGEDPVTRETNTDLSSVLTRAITLEGSDLFTAWLSREHTVEVGRRAGTALLLSTVFCELGLGREGCSNAAQDLTRRDKAFVADPLKWASFPLTHGVIPALLSGLPEYQELAKQVQEEQGDHYVPGLGHSESIAEINQRSQNAPPGAAGAADEDLARTALAWLPPLQPEPTLYESVDITPEGEVNIDDGIDGLQPGDPGYRDRYRQRTGDFINQPLALFFETEREAALIEHTQNLTEDQGEVASTQLVPNSTPPEGCEEGNCRPPESGAEENLSFRTAVNVPVNAKVGQVQAGIQALSDLNTNLRSISPGNLQDPTGTTKLLRALAGEDGGGNNGNDGSTGLLPANSLLAGNTLSPESAGQVAGAVAGDNDFRSGVTLERLFGPAPPVGVHQILPQGEDPLGGFLLAIIGKESGCNCGIDGLGNDFGKQLLQKVNQLSP